MGDSLGALLRQPVRAAVAVPHQADGIAIGTLDAIDADGLLRVSIPAFGLQAVTARSLVTADPARVGQAVALGFEAADPQRPIVLGFMLAQSLPATVLADGEHVVIEAQQQIELRCGEATIVLTADGQISLRGTYITSHASATQRIRGGSVQIN